MFSISELARASSNGRVLINIAGLGISSAACFNSARAARDFTHCFRTTLVSRSTLGGSLGRSFQGRSGFQRALDVMVIKSLFCDTLPAYVVGGDTSRKRVAI